jgi:hypothetical protein
MNPIWWNRLADLSNELIRLNAFGILDEKNLQNEETDAILIKREESVNLPQKG